MAHHLGRAKLSSASPSYGTGKTPFLAPFRTEPVYVVFSRVQRIFITVTGRCHSCVYIQLIYCSQTLSDLSPASLPGHTSFSIHGDKRVYCVATLCGYPLGLVYENYSSKVHFGCLNGSSVVVSGI